MRRIDTRALLIVLSCLLPIGALLAVIFFRLPVGPTTLVALALLIPLARRLLMASEQDPAEMPRDRGFVQRRGR